MTDFKTEVLEYLEYYEGLFIHETAEKNFITQMIQDIKTGRLEKR